MKKAKTLFIFIGLLSIFLSHNASAIIVNDPTNGGYLLQQLSKTNTMISQGMENLKQLEVVNNEIKGMQSLISGSKALLYRVRRLTNLINNPDAIVGRTLAIFQRCSYNQGEIPAWAKDLLGYLDQLNDFLTIDWSQICSSKDKFLAFVKGEKIIKQTVEEERDRKSRREAFNNKDIRPVDKTVRLYEATFSEIFMDEASSALSLAKYIEADSEDNEEDKIEKSLAEYKAIAMEASEEEGMAGLAPLIMMNGINLIHMREEMANIKKLLARQLAFQTSLAFLQHKGEFAERIRKEVNAQLKNPESMVFMEKDSDFHPPADDNTDGNNIKMASANTQ